MTESQGEDVLAALEALQETLDAALPVLGWAAAVGSAAVVALILVLVLGGVRR